MGGSSFVSHLLHAAAIDAGLGEVALVTYGSMQRSGRGRPHEVESSRED